jgi:hypothetical protein
MFRLELTKVQRRSVNEGRAEKVDEGVVELVVNELIWPLKLGNVGKLL